MRVLLVALATVMGMGSAYATPTCREVTAAYTAAVDAAVAQRTADIAKMQADHAAREEANQNAFLRSLADNEFAYLKTVREIKGDASGEKLNKAQSDKLALDDAAHAGRSKASQDSVASYSNDDKASIAAYNAAVDAANRTWAVDRLLCMLPW